MENTVTVVPDIRELSPILPDKLGHTTVLKSDDARIVVLTFPAGQAMKDHAAPKTILLQALDGHLRVTAGGEVTADDLWRIFSDEYLPVDADSDLEPWGRFALRGTRAAHCPVTGRHQRAGRPARRALPTKRRRRCCIMPWAVPPIRRSARTSATSSTS